MDADVICFTVVICQELVWRYSIMIFELRWNACSWKTLWRRWGCTLSRSELWQTSHNKRRLEGVDTVAQTRGFAREGIWMSDHQRSSIMSITINLASQKAVWHKQNISLHGRVLAHKELEKEGELGHFRQTCSAEMGPATAVCQLSCSDLWVLWNWLPDVAVLIRYHLHQNVKLTLIWSIHLDGWHDFSGKLDSI